MKFITEISILEVMVGQEEVQMENDKVKTVKGQKTSAKIKEVESFLIFTNFYKHFIKNFSYITKPFNKLKGKKNQEQKEEYQKTFKKLKKKITSQPVRIKDDRLYLFSFLFSFLLSFSYYRIVSIMSHITVTNCHIV